METYVVAATDNPCDVISSAAGTSYGKEEPSMKRLEYCFNNGHMSVFEHATVTFYISGISRACSHQLVRHRMASFVQKSQRYTKVEGNDWYVTPPIFRETSIDNIMYDSMMKSYLENYNSALAAGVKPEDARYLLPEATKTDIMMTMNVRELFHFWDLRLDSAAQWEIRQLANYTKECLAVEDEQWRYLVELYEGKEN